MDVPYSEQGGVMAAPAQSCTGPSPAREALGRTGRCNQCHLEPCRDWGWCKAVCKQCCESSSAHPVGSLPLIAGLADGCSDAVALFVGQNVLCRRGAMRICPRCVSAAVTALLAPGERKMRVKQWVLQGREL